MRACVCASLQAGLYQLAPAVSFNRSLPAVGHTTTTRICYQPCEVSLNSLVSFVHGCHLVAAVDPPTPSSATVSQNVSVTASYGISKQ